MQPKVGSLSLISVPNQLKCPLESHGKLGYCNLKIRSGQQDGSVLGDDRHQA